MHNLMTVGEKVAMAYRAEAPWHGLGTKLSDGCSLDDAIRAAVLDYVVSLAPMFLSDGRIVDSRQAVLRDGQDIIGTVGPGYACVQNRAAFDVVNVLVEGGDMMVETAGALGRGEVAWLLLKNHSEILVGGTDKVLPYLLVVTSHNGTRGVQGIPTAIRVVCNNTLNMVKERTAFSIRHTMSAVDKIKEAKTLMARFASAKTQAELNYTKMANRTMGIDALIEYWGEVFPVAKQVADDESRAVVAELLTPGGTDVAKDLLASRDDKSTNEERQEACEYLLQKSGLGNTVWGAYNAVTEYVDHVYVSRQDGTPKKNGAQSALFGGGAVIRNTAWKAAMDLVNGKN